MTAQSMSPEGPDWQCPICGHASRIEPSVDTGDAPCPRCGHLLWWCRDRVARICGVSVTDIVADTSFVDELQADSIDVVEFVMEVEEELTPEELAALHETQAEWAKSGSQARTVSDYPLLDADVLPELLNASLGGLLKQLVVLTPATNRGRLFIAVCHGSILRTSSVSGQMRRYVAVCSRHAQDMLWRIRGQVKRESMPTQLRERSA